MDCQTCKRRRAENCPTEEVRKLQYSIAKLKASVVLLTLALIGTNLVWLITRVGTPF